MPKRYWFIILGVLVIAAVVWGVGEHQGWFAGQNQSGDAGVNVQSHKPLISGFTGDSRELKQTQIVAALESPLPAGKNVIWCSPFQLAWNHARTDVIRAPIRLQHATTLADHLNNARQSETDLPASSYYAAAGLVKNGIVSTIQQEMAKRFPTHEKPKFDKGDPYDIIAYGYLNVSAPFATPFDVLHAPLRFEDSAHHTTQLTSFGVDKHTKKAPKSQVHVAYYVDNGLEYIVTLDSASDTQIVLASIAPKATLAATVADAEAKMTASTESKLGEKDTLVIPNMKWQIMHDFTALEHDHLANPGFTGYAVEKAEQSIDFTLDHAGAKLSSEATIVMSQDSEAEAAPRHLLFNRPFLIYLRQNVQGKSGQPFFAMWVDNPELLDRW